MAFFGTTEGYGGRGAERVIFALSDEKGYIQTNSPKIPAVMIQRWRPFYFFGYGARMFWKYALWARSSVTPASRGVNEVLNLSRVFIS